MSEHLKPGHEISPDRKVEHHKGAEKHVGSHEKEHHLAKHKSELEKSVEHHAVSKAEVASHISEKSHDQPSSHHVTKEIKKLTFERKMTRIRKRENPAERALSRVIHQPAVERLSEVASKSVARPSGVLGGGLLAFVGTLLLLYVTRKYGYEFNYLVFFMLFVGGFAVGAIIELLYHSFRYRNAE